MSDDRSTLAQKLLTYGALAFVLALILIPYLYVIVTAFKTPGEIYETSWIPSEMYSPRGVQKCSAGWPWL